MANITKYIVGTAIVSVMSADLNALANGSSALSTTVVDNATNLDVLGNWELVITSTANMTANAAVSMWLVPSVDGTNYADGTAANAAQPDLWWGDFIIPRAANSFRLALIAGKNCPLFLPPLKFKPLIKNSSGQAFLSVNTLKLETKNFNNNG